MAYIKEELNLQFKCKLLFLNQVPTIFFIAKWNEKINFQVREIAFCALIDEKTININGNLAHTVLNQFNSNDFFF